MFLSLNPKHRERRVGGKPLELGISLPCDSVPFSPLQTAGSAGGNAGVHAPSRPRLRGQAGTG